MKNTRTEALKRLTDPIAVLLIEIALLCLYFIWTGKLSLEVYPDSPVYRLTSEQYLFSLRAFKTDYPIGYPLFLKIANLFFSGYRALPYFQLIAYCGAIIVFFLCLCRSGVSRWASLLLSSSLLYSGPIACGWVPQMMSDSLASAFVMVAVGLLFLVIAKPNDWKRLSALGLAIFCAYQVRGVYIFLIAWVPVAGLALYAIVSRPQDYAKSRWYLTKNLLIVSLVPYLAFSLFRLFAVGHFGVVSTGGRCSLPYTSQFMDEKHLATLPKEVVPLASEILERRKLAENCFGQTFRFQSPVTSSAKLGLSFSPMSLQGWAMETCVIERATLALFKDNHIMTNRVSAQLSRAMILREPGYYSVWVLKSLANSIGQVATSTAFYVYIALLVLAGLGILTLSLVKGTHQLAVRPRGSMISESLRLINCCMLVGFFFFITKMSLVVLLLHPLPRYVFAAGIFLPLIPVSLLYAIISFARRQAI